MTMAPSVDAISPALSPVAYHPAWVPTHPARSAPAMPSSVVTRQPLGPCPGVNSRASAPAISPVTIHPMMPISVSPIDWCVL